MSLILFRELIISSLRNSTKDGLPASLLGKYKTFFFFISVITFFTPLKSSLLNDLSLIFYWLGFILTFVTLLDYLRTVSYTHLRAHETEADLVCRLLLEKKKNPNMHLKHTRAKQIKHQSD